MHHPTKGKCARRGCFLCPTIDAAFSLHCHFLAVGIFPVSFRRFASWLSLFVRLDRLVPFHASFGAASLSFFSLLLALFPPYASSFFALFGRRQSLVLRPANNGLFVPFLACARHAPARPVFRIIAFTSSPNVRNFLIWSVLR